MAFADDDDMVEDSRRTDPIRRSTKGFCQGARGALKTSSMPMPVSRSRKVAP